MENRVVNILMVEDDEVDVMNVRRIFQRSEIANPLFIANNGISALAVLRQEILRDTGPIDSSLLYDPIALFNQYLQPNPWLILLDMNLPQMSGSEFLQSLAQDSCLAIIPAVILISSPRDQERWEAKKLDVMGYMMKPVTTDRLLEILVAAEQYWNRLSNRTNSLSSSRETDNHFNA